MTRSRRRAEQGSIVVLFVGVLAGLVVAIAGEDVAGTLVRGHGRAHWDAENTARVAAQELDATVYHTTGARVLDLAKATLAAQRFVAHLTDAVDVADVTPENDGVNDGVSVTVVLHQPIAAGPAAFTLPIVETASATLQQP